jgi:hypothetical protein
MQDHHGNLARGASGIRFLRTKKPYTHLGADDCDQRDRKRIELHHVHRLEQLGYTVTLPVLAT